MNNLVTWAVCGFGVILAAGSLYMVQISAATERGRAIEQAAIAAKANQNIADRRVTDAKFKRDDVIKLCRDAGLEWFVDAGRSYCRPKPAG